MKDGWSKPADRRSISKVSVGHMLKERLAPIRDSVTVIKVVGAGGDPCV